MKIICVGSIKSKSLICLIDDYCKRIKTFSKLEIIEVKDVSNMLANRDNECQKIKDIEGERVLKIIGEKDYVILLDVDGESKDTMSFHELLQHCNTYLRMPITFVIGGSLGVSNDLRQRANIRFKISDLTFTHQMCRLILVEQIYRSYMILNNTPYHK